MEFAIWLFIFYWVWSGGFGQSIANILKLFTIILIIRLLFIIFPKIMISLTIIFIISLFWESYKQIRKK
ncbi:hypothetical protein EV697_10226 [Bisgaardia hudsonensis]|uniref:Uncharacterized protein n=1 Tax=Bisgaardia hudsonensis TaxID=109472 RepID=A0A4R2N0U3_9PAST|nr:hypothetical protein A6A11_06365 [Bisgaardia hudsonensis]TCP13155.1 hypothetical protein EV697_10226 [Bisgaardia hudsonensis]